MIDKTNNWQLPFIGSVILLFIGWIVAFWMRPAQGLAAPVVEMSPAAV